MNPKHKSDQRYNYVFTFMMRSFLIAKQKIQNEIQKIGISSINDVTIDQYLLNSLDKNLEILNSKDEQSSNDYYEDTLNLTLSNQQSNDLLNDLTNNNDLNQLFKLTDYDKENLNEDVLLKLPKHFDNYIVNIIKLLKDAFESNTNQDLKILTERNVDLSNQLKDELQSKNTLVQKLIEAEDKVLSNKKKIDLYEEEFKNLEELKRDNENLKQQLRKYNSEYRNFTKEKEELEKNILLFNENLPELQKTAASSSKLISKNLCSYSSLLSEELKNDLDQSRLQIELTERQRDDILNQLTSLKKERDKLNELNLRLRKELELQKDNFENEIKASKNRLDNQKRFIDSQTEERENEIDGYMAKLNELEGKLREKEIKESNYLEKIRHYEDQIEFINDEKFKLDKCYKETCNRLTNELKKNKQLSEALEEKERIKEQTEQIKKELEERIAKIEEDLNNQLKINETLRKDKTEQSKLLINSFVDNVCESVNDNVVEQLRCSTNQQSLFDDQSNLIQKTIDEKLNHFTIDESSTFYDDQKLIEGNLRLGSYVEKYVKTNRDLNDELEEAKNQNLNLNKKIINLEDQINNYKLKLEEMCRERKILEELLSEKNSKLNELQDQLKERTNDNENKDKLKQSIECLEKKLKEEELKIKELNDKVKRTELKLNKKQEENYRILNEVERAKLDNNQLEKDYQQLQKANKKLNKERSKLLQEIEDLQNERDDLDDQSDIREMFETVLQDKDEEIDNLNCCLNEINAKLRECLPTSTFGQNNLILLDELILNYKKFLRTKNHHFQSNGLFHQTRLESESYSSFSPVESLNDDNQNDDLNDDDEFDDEIRNKLLVGIHNNSLEIHNLSICLKNEQSLIKLINEIPDIVTNDNLTRKDISDWKFNFIDCFSNKNIGELLTKIIISLRTPFLNNQTMKLKLDQEKDDLVKQIEFYKDKLRKEQLELRKCNSKRKELIFQKKYLLNLNSNKTNHCHHHHHQFNCQPFNYYQSNRTTKFNRFKIVSLCLIAVLRIRKLRKIREFNENNEQLINKLDQFKLKNNIMPNVLNPSIEKFSSFINSLNPNSNQLKNKVPLNHYTNRNFNNKDNEPRLKDLYVNLKKVNHNLGFQSSSLSSSTCSSLSNFN